MLNVEEDLRNREIPLPKISVYEPMRDDVELITYVHPGHSAIKFVIKKAEIARRTFLEESKGISDQEKWADIEYNKAVRYWAVVLTLAIGEERAHELVGKQAIIDYIEEKLGSEYLEEFDALSDAVTENTGLKVLIKDIEAEAEEEEEIAADKSATPAAATTTYP